MTKVFVYGSLMSGFGNNDLLGDSKKVGDAVIHGWKLMTLGAFPAMVDSCVDCDVVGEVYEVGDETLARMDGLEGYDSDTDDGMYVRKTLEVAVSYEGFPKVVSGVLAEVYVWNGDDDVGSDISDDQGVSDWRKWKTADKCEGCEDGVKHVHAEPLTEDEEKAWSTRPTGWR